jgi:hypothetical protein
MEVKPAASRENTISIQSRTCISRASVPALPDHLGPLFVHSCDVKNQQKLTTDEIKNIDPPLGGAEVSSSQIA